MENNRCYNCKMFLKQDTGYSNWTVMGTDISCMKNHFETIEESYSWIDKHDSTKDHEFFKRAVSCPDFKQETGIQACFDVDGETTIEDFKEDLEVYNAYNDWMVDNK